MINSETFYSRFLDFYHKTQHVTKSMINFDYMKEYFNVELSEFPSDEEICEIQKKLHLTRNSNKQKKNWTFEEKKILIWMIGKITQVNQQDSRSINDEFWNKIAQCINRRDSTQCQAKWLSLLKQPSIQNPWTTEEDQVLKTIILEKNDQIQRGQKWCQIASIFKQAMKYKTFRTSKQCRERWLNHLNPSLNKEPWTNQEDLNLIKLVEKMGKKWSDISRIYNTSRSENSVKNRYYQLLKREGFNTKHCQNENFFLQKALEKVQNLLVQEVKFKKNPTQSQTVIQCCIESDQCLKCNNTSHNLTEQNLRETNLENNFQTKTQSFTVVNQLEAQNFPNLILNPCLVDFINHTIYQCDLQEIQNYMNKRTKLSNSYEVKSYDFIHENTQKEKKIYAQCAEDNFYQPMYFLDAIGETSFISIEQNLNISNSNFDQNPIQRTQANQINLSLQDFQSSNQIDKKCKIPMNLTLSYNFLKSINQLQQIKKSRYYRNQTDLIINAQLREYESKLTTLSEPYLRNSSFRS